jgi:hypothetical protein
MFPFNGQSNIINVLHNKYELSGIYRKGAGVNPAPEAIY